MDMDVKKLLGKRIREYRLKKGLTQCQLANLVGIDGKHLSCIELGKNMPNPQLIYKFSQNFSCEIKELFEFYHLQESSDIKKELSKLIDKLGETELKQAYQYIRAFVL